MADFKIKLNTELNSEKAESQLKELQNKANKKPMKIKTELDLKTFDSQVSALKKSLNSAFKLDKSQMSNLKEMKTLIQEINKLSKQAQKSIFGSSSDSKAKNEVSNVKNLVKEYDRLQAKQKSIEQQMSKTSNKQSYAVLSQELSKARSEAEKVGVALDKVGAVKGNSNITKSLANTFQSVNKQIDSTETKINKLLKNKNLGSEQSNSLVQLKSNLEDLRNINLDSIIDAEKPYAEMSKLVKGVQELKTNFNNLDIDIKFNDKLVKAESSIDSLISKFKILSKSGFSDKGEINNTVSELEKLKASLNGIDINSSGATSQLNEIEASIKECSNAYEQLNNESRSNKLQFNFDTKLDKTISDLQLLRDKCEQLGSGVDEVNRLENELQQLGNVDLDKASSELTRIRSEMTTLGKTINNSSTVKGATRGFFSDLYQTMTTFSLGNILADQIQQGIYAIKDTIIGIDSAFRDLMKVAPTDFQGTTQQLDELRDKAISAGQEVAKSSVDIIESTANALQSGFKNVDEALQYAKESAKFSNVSDMDQESTDKALRSILSSYGGVENSLKGVRTEIQGASSDYSMLNQVMDAANYIGNNYSTSTQSVAEGMQNAGASLKTMGASVTDSMAYFTAINEIMQNAGKSSNGLKAIAQNMTGITVSAKDGSLKLNKSALALKEYAKIDIQKPNGELRDMGDVLDELGGKWKDLGKTQQQALMVAIGGKQRSSQFSALMDNWETVKQIQQEIASGAALGSADKENARYIDSIEGRIVKLQEELRKLVVETINTDMFKGMVSGLTSFVSGLNSVIGALDKLGISTPVVASGLAGIMMTIKGLGTGNGVPNILGSLVSGFNLLKGSSNGVGKQLNVIKEVTEDVAEGMGNATGGISGFASGLSKAGSSSLVASLGVSALNAGIMALAGVAITLAIKQLYEFAHANEIAMQAHEENINNINSKISGLKSEKSSLKSIAEEYDNLAKKTSRTSEEQERYNELRNQIAEISPDLVSGYDSDNNAILALNGSLENYINNLDQAINRQKELLMQQQNAEATDASNYLQEGVNRDSYKKYEQAKVTADVESKKIEAASTKVYNAIQRFTGSSEKSFTDSINRIRTAREEHATQIEESYTRISEEQDKINEYSSKLSQKAQNKVSSSNQIKKATDEIKTFASTVTSTLDFSSLKSGQIDTYARNLAKALGDGEIDGALLKYKQLRDELERTGDTTAYQNNIKSLIPELSQMLGLNEEVVESMTKLPPTMTAATSSLDAYLQSFGKRESMQGFDADTNNLIKQYEAFSGMIDDLGMLEAQEVNGEVQFDLTAVTDIVNREDVPKQVQDLFNQMKSDGKFTDEEMEIMMRISAGMTSDDPEQRSELLGQAQQLVDQLFPNNEIDIGSLDVSAEYKLNEDSKKDLAEQIGDLGDKEFVATIKANVENYDQLQMYQEAVSQLQGDKTNIQNMISANINNFGEMQSYEEMVAWLLDHPDVANEYSISVVGANTIDAVSKKVDKLDLSKDEKKSIMVEVQEGDLEGLLGEIDKLPPEKQVRVLSEISQALSGIDTVDARTLNDKITDILAIDNATGKVNYVDQYKKLMKKDVNIQGHDNASSVINGIDLSPVTKWIYVKAKQVGSAVSNFFGGGYQPPVIKNASEFSNISDVPQETTTPLATESQVAPMSSTFSTPTSTPTEGASPSATSDSSNQLSAKSVGSFGSVLTSPTQSTKISKSYKNVLNMIKYGINLFQELENRISRTANQLDLLSIKMENAVGTKKISYLKQQNTLYKEQAKLQKTLFNSLYNEKQSVQKKLKKSGFTLNKQGNLTSYEEKLLKLEKEAERAEKASSNYKGKNNKTKNRLEKNAESAKKKLDEAKNLTEEYLSLQYKEIPAAEQEWANLQNAIKENNNEIEKLKFADKIHKEQNAIEKLNASITQYKNYADRSEIRADNTSGTEKIKNLKSQLDYTKELVKLNNELISQSAKERGKYKNKLREYGAKFDINGQLSNQDALLNKYQNSENLDKIKDWIKEYNDLYEAERDVKNETLQLGYSIEDLNNEVKKLELENKVEPFTVSVGLATQNITKLNNELDILDVKLKNAVGKEKIDLLDEQVKKWQQLKIEQEKVLKGLKSEESTYQKSLSEYGFNFDASGNMTNKDSILSKLKNHKDYEYIKDTVDKWEELYNDSIPNANKSILEYENSVRDAYQSQLDITKDIEDKITNMYKDQIEKRKDAIKKETEAITKELEKQRRAYKDMRDEVDYQNDYKEKTDTVSDLQKQLEIAKKDTSLSNRKKIADLEKQLADAQKDLDKFVQDKIDSDIDNSFQESIDKANEDSDKKIEDLENLWSDSKIAEAVKDALKTGLFTDIDGEVSNLKDSLLDFAETSGELFGVTGDIIANDWCGNLDIALNTMNNLNSIMKKMEVPKFESTFKGANLETNSLTTGDISINISAKTNSSPEDIGDEVAKKFQEMLNQLKQGL